MLSANDEQKAAEAFVKTWQAKIGTEEQLSRSFWLDLLQKVLGETDATSKMEFEKHVGRGKIDVYLKNTKTIIEQKSRGKDLDAAFLQAFEYNALLPNFEKADSIAVCDFDEFRIYDMNVKNPKTQAPRVLKLADLPQNVAMLRFLVDEKSDIVDQQKEISIQAAQLIGKLYDALLKQYPNPDATALENLNRLCVRLVFCLYAENAGVFAHNKQFGDYLNSFLPENAALALQNLFEVLNTDDEKRKTPKFKCLPTKLQAFPYVNGGLFETAADDGIPPFNAEIFNILVKDCSQQFDWARISPTIFGAMFESTLNPQTRRQGGMHYTTEENIHKVIDPLFLNDLTAECEKLTNAARPNAKKLQEFQKKLAELTFLDPACGSGNFLTETYISLRRLENKVLAALSKGNLYLTLGENFSTVKVSLNQFYGIEINDFAVSVARAAMWIAESQMLMETEKILGEKTPEFLPLKNHTNIVEGNALRMKWEEIVPLESLDFVMGNPPFSGARIMGKEQKEDLINVAKDIKNAGNLDYVCGWFLKLADLINQNPNIKTALVATNSICQGENVTPLWQPIFEKGIHIDFAHRTFKWDSETENKANVHVVIVGFSKIHGKPQIFLENGNAISAKQISPYLTDSPAIFVENRPKPLCDIPKMEMGNMPLDDGNFLFSESEKDEFLKKEPAAEKFFRLFLGAEEFINNKKRYCLWLKDSAPHEIKKMRNVMERIQKVQKFRSNSKRIGTIKAADRPNLFAEIRQPDSNYLLLPVISSERRKYIPIGFLPPEIIASSACQIIPRATLYDFGILTSKPNNAWIRAVAGRLEMRYRYSKGIVYNNFIWPQANEKQKAAIAALAQKVLAARGNYPKASLADLYDPLTMPADLQSAHKNLDAAVLKLYGFKPTASEPEIVAHLFKLYAEKTNQKWD